MRASSIDQYALYGEIAAGGMATVHLGRRVGPVGFARTVAVKRLYGQFAREREFVDTFLDEARLAASIHHPNVVPTVDVVATADELLLVMEYVHGDSLAGLLRATRQRGETIPLPIALAIVAGALHGLHAAHEARGPKDEPLGIIHRDVSPQNVMVGVDGIARVCDFGIAKAASRQNTTRDGQLKGKLGYMAPERLGGEPCDRRADVYAMGLVLWETLVGKRAFVADDLAAVMHAVLTAKLAAPSASRPDVPPELDALVAKATSVAPGDRYPTALAMAEAIEAGSKLASTHEVGKWVADVASELLAERRAILTNIEQKEDTGPLPVTMEASLSAPAIEAAPAEQPRPAGSRGRRSAPFILGIVAACLVAASAVSIVATRRSAAPRVAVATPAAPSAEPAHDPSPPSASVVAEPSASPARVPAPSATARHGVPVRTAPRAGRKSPACVPPWVIEPDGTKRYKPECL